MAEDDFVSKILAKLLDPSYPRRDVVETLLSWFRLKTPIGDFSLSTGTPKSTAFADATAMIDLFDEAFDILTAAWIHRVTDASKIDPRKGVLVVFIDDLDRCLPQKTIQVLEAIKLFLGKTGCIFVIGADTNVIKQNISKELGLTNNQARQYLEKMIQINFEIPPILGSELFEYAAANDVPTEFLENWESVIEAADISLNNIRKLKLYLNDLMFRWFMLTTTRLAPDANLRDFITWQKISRVAPSSFFDRLRNFTDLESRYEYLMSAIEWGNGDKTRASLFIEYASDEFSRFRKSLGEIEFSDDFNPEILDVFVRVALPSPIKQSPDVALE